MQINYFKIKLYDFVRREYVKKSKKLAVADKPRIMYSFTLYWEGLVDGEDALNQSSYLGSEHTGCMFFMQGEDLAWGFAKTTTWKGQYIVPHRPILGLTQLVLSSLKTTSAAKELIADAEERRLAFIPDPEKQPEGEKVEIS